MVVFEGKSEAAHAANESIHRAVVRSLLFYSCALMELFCEHCILVSYSRVQLETFSSSSALTGRFWTTSKFPPKAVYLFLCDRFNMHLNIGAIIQSTYNIFEAVSLIWFNSALSQCNTQQYNAMQSVSVYFKYGFVTIWRIFHNKSILGSGRTHKHCSVCVCLCVSSESFVRQKPVIGCDPLKLLSDTELSHWQGVVNMSPAALISSI